jgi:hypothetical protein
MFELPIQPLSIQWEIAQVRAIIHLMKQNNGDSDREISKEKRGHDHYESTMSSDIKEDRLDNEQEVLYLDQTHCDKTI